MLEVFADLVADAAEECETGVVRASKRGRILEAVMDPVRVTRVNGAALVRVSHTLMTQC